MITTDEFTQNFESRTQTDVVVLDLSKAFDVVPHQRLSHKLDHYGIRGTTLTSIQKNRTQKVVVDGSSSESARVRSGVPQGTVLGPLLFLTYIIDLPSTVSSQVRLFADDCLLYRPIKCRADQEQLQRDHIQWPSFSKLQKISFINARHFSLRLCNSLLMALSLTASR